MQIDPRPFKDEAQVPVEIEAAAYYPVTIDIETGTVDTRMSI